MNLRSLVASACILFTAGLLSGEEPEESDIKHSLRIQVLLVESPGKLDEESRRQLSGPAEKVMSALSKLEREEKAAIINHVDMTVLEECESMLQIGESVAIRTGTVRLGSGREQTSYQDVNTGTIVQLKSKVSGQQVLVDLDFSKSTVQPRGEQDEAPQGTSQLTHQTTFQIKDGNALAVGGMMQQSDDQRTEFLFVVAADILESSSVQVMKFQSSSRPPIRAGMAMAPRGRGPSSGRPSQEEIRKRMGSFAETMFDRADVNKDGVISKDEVAKLGPRNYRAEPPVTKDQYVEWMTSKLAAGQRGISGRGSATSGVGRPTAPPQDRRGASDNNEEKSKTEPETKEQEAADTDNK
nr:hypothetical protein [Rhodopirellula sp. SM50]